MADEAKAHEVLLAGPQPDAPHILEEILTWRWVDGVAAAEGTAAAEEAANFAAPQSRGKSTLLSLSLSLSLLPIARLAPGYT